MTISTTRKILSTAAAAGVLSLATAVPANAEPDWGTPGSTGGSGSTSSDGGSQTVIREVFVDDDALEYLQVGLGALAGMALTGAAVVGIRRAGRQAPHPA